MNGCKARMIPAGYMAKHVIEHPGWLETGRVNDIYSVSNCVSECFANYLGYWKHNGYWVFDSPGIIREIAREHAIDLTGTKLFFYEIYEFEYDEICKSWRPFAPEASFDTQVIKADAKNLEGYDVVTFFSGGSPECSPLSCNSLASRIETNAHCLLTSLENAKELLEKGEFDNSEPGPFRIFAVYSVQWS